MSPGLLVFAQTKGSISGLLIRFFTRSKWTHCFLTTPDYCSRPMCLEVSGSGIDLLDFNIGYRSNAQQIYEAYEVESISEDDKETAIRAILSRLEQPYGYLAFPWFVWRWVLEIFGKSIKGQDNWYTHDMVCSGLCDEFLRLIGLGDLVSGFGRGASHQEDLYRIVKQNPKIFRLVERRD